MNVYKIKEKNFSLEFSFSAKKSYITGKTFGKTTDASAKYSYNVRISDSSVVFRTNVAYLFEEKKIFFF